MEFALACRELGVRPITGAELTACDGDGRPPDPAGREPGRLPQPLPAATAAHSHTRDGAQRSARAAVGGARAGRGARRGPGLSLGLRPRRGCWRAPGSGRDAAAGAALGRRLLGAFGRDRFRVELQRPFWRRDRARNRWLAGLAERLGVPASPPATSTATTAAAPASRTPSSRCAWGRSWRPPSRAAAATELRPGAPREMAERFAEHPEAVAETLRLAERLASTSPRSSATATPAPRTSAPTASWPRSAGRGSTSATRGPPRPRRGRAELEQELTTIRNLGLSGFFLLHREILELAREVALEVRGPESARAVLPPAAAAAPASARSSAT